VFRRSRRLSRRHHHETGRTSLQTHIFGTVCRRCYGICKFGHFAKKHTCLSSSMSSSLENYAELHFVLSVDIRRNAVRNSSVLRPPRLPEQGGYRAFMHGCASYPKVVYRATEITESPCKLYSRLAMTAEANCNGCTTVISCSRATPLVKNYKNVHFKFVRCNCVLII